MQVETRGRFVGSDGERVTVRKLKEMLSKISDDAIVVILTEGERSARFTSVESTIRETPSSPNFVFINTEQY